MKPATGSSSSREATKNWRPSQLRAHAKLTEEVGVCIGTSGPGVIHLLNGLYEAKLDHQPMVATAGQQVRVAVGSSYMQEIDLLSLFTDVAHEYVQYCMALEQAAHLIDRTMPIGKVTELVTCIIVPDDVAESEYQKPPPIIERL
jgi:pyruvate dehydrogenase (quinone)